MSVKTTVGITRKDARRRIKDWIKTLSDEELANLCDRTANFENFIVVPDYTRRHNDLPPYEKPIL